MVSSQGSDFYNEGDPMKKKGSLEERMTILSIAYHNLAVEHEFLNDYE